MNTDYQHVLGKSMFRCIEGSIKYSWRTLGSCTRQLARLRVCLRQWRNNFKYRVQEPSHHWRQRPFSTAAECTSKRVRRLWLACTFMNNYAIKGFGGGMYNMDSNPTLEKLHIHGQHCHLGGGMYNNYSSPTLDACTFVGNTASGVINTAYTGGGMYNVTNSSPRLTELHI